MKTSNQQSAISNFWHERFEKNGHTGWANRKIYFFDQWCRLQRLADFLDTIKIPPGKVLDFGCGSGDFSKLLINRGWDVVAYDPFVTPKITNPKLTAIQQIEKLKEYGPYDLIISITVLDHCLDDLEFQARLNDISQSLKIGAQFFFLEYAPDSNRQKTTYQSFRSKNQWLNELKKVNLHVSNIIPYFHPEEASIESWNKYKNNFSVKLYLWLSQLNISTESEIKNIAKQYLTQFPYKSPNASPIKIISGNRES